MSCRTTGVTMMSTGSVQEVMDLAAVAHLTTIKTRVPFIHFHDGFRTSHEIQKIEVIDLDKVEKLLDRQALEDYHAIAMNPEHPVSNYAKKNWVNMFISYVNNISCRLFFKHN